MKDHDKTRRQLMAELAELRRQVASLETAAAEGRQAAEERRRSEAKWRLVAENAPLFVAVVDRLGHMQFLNRFRPGFTPETVLGRPIYDFLDPRYHAIARECLERVLQTGENASYESVGAGPEGTETEYVTDIGPVIVDGHIVAATLMSRDITDRKRAESQIRRERNLAQQYLDVAGVIMVALDHSGNIRLLNRKGDVTLGYDDGELLGKNWFDTCVPQRIRDEMKAVFADVIAAQAPLAEYYDNPVITKCGEERIIAWHNAVLTDETGAIVGTLSSGLDITERKQVEEALRESEARSRLLADVIELSSQPFGMGYPDGSLGIVNTAYCDLVGYSQEELRRLDWSRDLTPPEWHALEAQHLDQLFRTRKPIRYEKEYVRKDGSRVPIELLVHVVCDQSGRPQYYYSFITDLTERKRAEAALRKAHDELERRVEERTAELHRANEELTIFRRFADASGQGFSMADLDGRLMYLNPALCRMLGHVRPEEYIGQHLSICYSEEANRRGREEVEPAVGQNGCWEGELSLLSRQGKSIPTWQHAFTIRDDQGNPLRLAVVITDITERKTAEQTLRQSERRFRNYFEQGLIGMAVTSVDKRWLEVNDRLCEIMGRAREELLQQTWTEMTHPDDLEPNFQLFSRLLAREIEHFTMDKRFLRKDGSIVYTTIHTRAFRRDDGTTDHIVTLIEDISARKHAEEAFRASHEEVRSIYQGLRDGVLIADTETLRFVQANPVMCEMLGYSQEEVLSLSVNAIHPPERLPFVLDKFRQNSEGQLWIAGDIPVLRKDGTVFYADIATNRLSYRGRPCVIGFFRDVTDRKQAEEALERERQSLWRMLQSSDHERQIISYDIHDGLAQYLAAATMQFQACNSLRESHPDEAKKAYETAVELVRQAHGESRRLISEVRPPVIDENGLEMAVSHLVHEYRRRGGPQIECRSDVQFGRLPSILENSLYRIAQEALTNACKHSKSKKVTVTMTQEGQDVRLEMQDWGIGFDPDSVGPGHFGLEGIRQRVRLLGGRLTIESTPGSGTLVQVVVPILERHAEG